MWFSCKCCDIFVEDKTKTMNRKTSQGETPVFVNLLSDAGFEAVKALQKKVLSEEAKR